MSAVQHSLTLPSGSPWPDALVSAVLQGDAQQVVMRHTGTLSHADIERLVAEVEAHSLGANDSVVVRKRLLNVVVESLENVRVHAEERFAATAFALLTRDESGYRLLVGNALPSATAELLLSRVEHINAMDEADLKEHFLRLLSNEGRTERGGAGLGLLTIARKAARPLLPIAMPRDGESRYFVLEARVLRDR